MAPNDAKAAEEEDSKTNIPVEFPSLHGVFTERSLSFSPKMNATNSHRSRVEVKSGLSDLSMIGSTPTETVLLNASEKPGNGSNNSGPGVIIRGEEVGIVVVVLLLWVGAIVMFFNRWGKIRMLEPYQPKFCEDHRSSCPMAEVTTVQQYPRTFSKCNISTDLLGSPHFAKCNYHGVSSGRGIGPSIGVLTRPRQNSVFVTSPHSAAMAINSSYLQSASRKTKSAVDLSTLVLTEEFLENVRRNSKTSITHL